MKKVEEKDNCPSFCISRRKFLLAGGAATATLLIPGIGRVAAAESGGDVYAKYPRMKIGKVSKLKQDVPVEFDYPVKYLKNLLVKLGVPAGGGVGPNKDIVAFNPVCTHMGGPLQDTYKPEHKTLGLCPFHQSIFDLTRHGIIVAGHATESLPQIELEVEGDDIYAVGISGLLFGCADNIKDLKVKKT